ncbi:Lytic transglycosylase catalytic [Thermocrinis albus DSM 14484]|uniref:Lytic transglycosylase catalytic n=1 Tax=Thermocrinis albus (strain DSM 14484 / JCM 11386 / HI 11/12) TaxID=638303 RepID=D3SPS8_THEAH|nr:lytic transglycosylase domain-containing protein [Thermocrinis albus]ADC89165.1 Lytic transglycosylase catalytic [Thermocrinis albus DSM 14484]
MVVVLVLLAIFELSFGFYHCFFEAGKRYGVDPYLLVAIAKVESNFVPTAIHHNGNGSTDYGIMQINSYWLKRYKIPIQWIMEPCYNIHMGAMVLKRCIISYGYTPKAIDCYNKGSPRGDYSHYVIKVYQSYARVKALVE